MAGSKIKQQKSTVFLYINNGQLEIKINKTKNDWSTKNIKYLEIHLSLCILKTTKYYQKKKIKEDLCEGKDRSS